MLKAGIVGLPNVGKSTLFNAVTRTRKAEAANYPFCTIDPNVGIVTVPDARLEVLRRIAKTNVVIPAAIEFVDIAGLHHVAGSVGPVRDIEVVNTELLLADLESVKKRRERVTKDAKRGDKSAI